MHSVVAPVSGYAHSIATLWWWMLGVGGGVWLIVSALAISAAFARRGERGPDDLFHVTEPAHHRIERLVQVAVGLTVVILLTFLIADFAGGRSIGEHPDRALTIEVIGHQWWWEVDYANPNPANRVTTANEIH